MSYKIVGDSCCDYTEKEKGKDTFIQIPLILDVDGFEIVDDDSFDQADFLQRVAHSKGCPRSACPAPEDYMRAYEQADDIYVITLSSELSGSYNSAMLAKNLYAEEYGSKNIHVFNSKSASSGQLLICRFVEQMAEDGKEFAEIVEKTEQYIEGLSTYFVLETLDFLQKNGRLSRVQAILAGALNIKPVMGAEDGTIIKLGQVRGMKKAINSMIDHAIKECHDRENKDLVIAHCNCYQRALDAKAEIEKKAKFRSITIVNTRGVSSLYAGDGGVIIAC